MSSKLNRRAKNGLRLLKTFFSTPTFHFACSAGCGNNQNDDVFQPHPIHPKSPYHYDDIVSSPTFSLNLHHQTQSNDAAITRATPSTTPRRSSASASSKLGESVAVVKESDDPYLDFRHSMLQMIFEKEIFTQEDLQELLSCFLRLNSPCHHDDIVRAFSEIWTAVMSPATPKHQSPYSGVY